VRTLPHHRAATFSRNDAAGILKVVKNRRVPVVFWPVRRNPVAIRKTRRHPKIQQAGCLRSCLKEWSWSKAAHTGA